MSRTRDKSVTLWLTRKEREELKEMAAWFGMSVQEHLRHAALGQTLEQPSRRRDVLGRVAA